MAGFPPKKNTAFTFYTALVSQADTDIFKTSPTLAAGDIMVSIDGGNFANIGTLPTQVQSTGVLPVALTAGEMNGDVIVVKFVDAAGAEWQDQLVVILTDAIQLSDIEGQTDDIGVAGAGLTGIPWNAAWDAEVQSEVTDGLNAYDPPTKAEVDALMTTAQTESYATDGAAATPAQLLYMIWALLAEKSVSSTTLTVNKLDGTTAAMTFTLNDASAPTAITRAS